MSIVASDADLVHRYLAGDQRALGDIYERYGDRVYDLCFAMLNSADDAADAYQDTFLTAAHKLGQLRDADRLRSWLYSVARNQCRARLRARKRSTPDENAGLDVGVDVDMTADVGRHELRELMTEASTGLNDRDREVLELHMRHELEGEELADALGVSVQNAYKLVQRVRDRVERSLGSLLVARHGRRDCPDLDELLAGWDGAFSPLMRKRISRHIDDCDSCSRRRAGLMDPGGLAGAFPLRAAPDALKAQLQATLLSPPEPTHEIRRWRNDGFPGTARRVPKLLMGAIAAGVLFVGGVAGGLVLAEVLDDSESRLETVAPGTDEPVEVEPVEDDPPATTSVPTTTVPPTTTTAAAAPTTTALATTTTAAIAPSTTTTAPPPPSTTAPPSTTTTTSTTSTTTTAAPPPTDTAPPTIQRLFHSPNNNRADPVKESPCVPRVGGPSVDTVITVVAVVDDGADGSGVESVTFGWTLSTGQSSGKIAMSSNDGINWSATVTIPSGTVSGLTTLRISGSATDAAGNTSTDVDSAGNPTFVEPC